MAHEIEGGMVEVDDLRAYLSRPTDPSTAGMLLLPMVTGIGAQVREFADDIARTGVTALSWDPWHGPSTDDTSRERLFELMGRLDDEQSLAEMRRLLDHMHSELGLSRVGVIGFCMGGRFALLLGARDERLANVVAYHPTVPATPAPNHTVDAVEATGRITAPVLMLYPGADSLVPWESFTRLQSALHSRETGESLVHVYPRAEHGFTDRARRESSEVNAAAHDLSWPQVMRFIATTTA
ncbi:dienelactone hydrolase family protein [Saccharomonospora iraqiensis]|uniref:dienelactone hydrolase family protein n=1 Tax=Saccharomonospora iraqiensis TaxID=52698 RepID=UPI0003FA9A4F|nr:dienelactone hydrolase family protein [Saccharomonospora iraqiensis]